MFSATDKILAHGVSSLSDEELLSILLDDMSNGNEVAQRIIGEYKPLSTLASLDLSRLRMVEGLGVKRAVRILSAIELGARSSSSMTVASDRIISSSDVINLFKGYMSKLRHEECWVLYLNTSNRVVEQQRISQGGINTTVIDHRLVVKRALELLATQIVLVHNHPSGDVNPSSEDLEVTQRIDKAAALFDINLLDHIIISPTDDYSMLSGKDIKRE